MRRAAIAACLLLVFAVEAAPAADDRYWPQWRGPRATGVAPASDPPATWSETENVRWKVALPGEGQASPVVWDDRVFVLAAVPAGSGEGSGGGFFTRLRRRIMGTVGGGEQLQFVVLRWTGATVPWSGSGPRWRSSRTRAATAREAGRRPRR